MQDHFGYFEWDDRKAALNVRKHGVEFEEAHMKITKAYKSAEKGDILPDYDFSKGDKPNYAKKFSDGAIITIHSSNSKSTKKKLIHKQSLVILDADVSKVFPDAKSVNSALRHLIAALPKTQKKAA